MSNDYNGLDGLDISQFARHDWLYSVSLNAVSDVVNEQKRFELILLPGCDEVSPISSADFRVNTTCLQVIKRAFLAKCKDRDEQIETK